MARPETDIDPRSTHVEPKRRRRRDRKKPGPPSSLAKDKAGSRARVETMPLSPGVMLEPRGDGYVSTSIHNDRDLWELQMAEAFGSRSISVRRTFLSQLRRLAPEVWDDDHQRWRADETVWNAALAMVADHQPENASQAALAAQMAEVHLMTMKLSEQALNRGSIVMEKDAALAAKMARTYAQQCETMMVLKGKRQPVRQSITVEKTLRQEVHYHDHRTGESVENADQSHGKDRNDGTTRKLADLREVSSSDEGGEVVPITRSRG